jgi:hypothetical protein
VIDVEQRLRGALSDPALAPRPPSDPVDWVHRRVRRDRRRRAAGGVVAVAVVSASAVLAATRVGLAPADRLDVTAASTAAADWAPPPAERAVASASRLPKTLVGVSAVGTVDVVLEGDAGRAGQTALAIFQDGGRYCSAFLDTPQMLSGCAKPESQSPTKLWWLTGQTTSGAGYAAPEAFAWGWAPAGTTYVTLHARGDQAVTLRAYPATDSKFDGRAFFFGRYDVMRPIQVTAYDANRDLIDKYDFSPGTPRSQP